MCAAFDPYRKHVVELTKEEVKVEDELQKYYIELEKFYNKKIYIVFQEVNYEKFGRITRNS